LAEVVECTFSGRWANLSNLGLCYSLGTGVPEDEKQAVEWYRKAAGQDYAKAQLILGICYEFGIGVAKNEEQAVVWYRKAAEQGDATAQCNLGVCYELGIGVTKNEEQAVVWFRKAAEQDHPRALHNLGICIRDGRGTPKDEKKGVMLVKEAKVLGYEEENPTLRPEDVVGVWYSSNQGEFYRTGYGCKKHSITFRKDGTFYRYLQKHEVGTENIYSCNGTWRVINGNEVLAEYNFYREQHSDFELNFVKRGVSSRHYQLVNGKIVGSGDTFSRKTNAD
jgi:hypothetical protein